MEDKQMAVKLEEIMAELPPERRERIEVRTKELIAEQMMFQDMRKARKYALERVAELLDFDCDRVLKLEQHADLFLANLRSYIAEMGGELKLTVEFTDRPPIILNELTDLAELEEEEFCGKHIAQFKKTTSAQSKPTFRSPESK
jgi:hypothetical protein